MAYLTIILGSKSTFFRKLCEYVSECVYLYLLVYLYLYMQKKAISFSCSYLLHGLLGRICTECNCYKTVVDQHYSRLGRVDQIGQGENGFKTRLARLVGVRVYCTKPAEDVYNIHVLQRIWRRCIIYIFGFHQSIIFCFMLSSKSSPWSPSS